MSLKRAVKIFFFKINRCKKIKRDVNSYLCKEGGGIKGQFTEKFQFSTGYS